MGKNCDKPCDKNGCEKKDIAGWAVADGKYIAVRKGESKAEAVARYKKRKNK